MKNRFDELNEVDWKSLGLKCGVEIHQQLFTERKLFCRCPAGLYTAHHDARVIRHMRPTLSELGEYDGTALMEFKTKKNITYLLDRRSVCTYEMDDTPPFEVNREAVDIAMEIAISLGCQIVGEMHVIRKQYLDGSIPTGFQRTAIVGVRGSLPFRGREIGITQVSVEEDSCREVMDTEHDIVFRTDRLSMPLVEVVTDPDMRTPEEAREVVRLIGRVMRSTGRVRRGAGATRQDVNVSVEGGTRVEIKGVPSISLIADLVAGEGLRQHALLELSRLLAKSGKDLAHDRFEGRCVASIFKDTSCQCIRSSLARGNEVYALRIPDFVEFLQVPVGKTRKVADEIAGRVRVIACLDEQPVLLHGGNYEYWGIDGREWRLVRKRVRARSKDGVIVLRGSLEDIITGIQEIEIRVKELWSGVQGETRQVGPFGETDFERILPGPDRMYPDTDSPPMAVSDDWLEKLKERQKTPIWETEESLRSDGLPEDVVDRLALSSLLNLYQKALAAGVSPLRAGELLSRHYTALEREQLGVDKVPESTIYDLMIRARDGKMTFEAIPMLLADAARSPELGAESLIERRGITPLSEKEVEEKIDRLLAEESPPLTADPEARVRYYMGRAMPQLLGSSPGRTVRRLVEKSVGGMQ